MSKLQSQKSALIKRICICTAILAVLGGGCYGVAITVDGYLEETRKLKSALHRDRAKIADLEQKYGIYEESYAEFTRLDKEYNDKKFTLNIESTRVALNNLRQKFRINDLSVDISPQKKLGEDQKYVGYTPVRRTVKLKFAGMSDVHIFNFIKAINASLGGYIYITNINITRDRQVTDDLIATVATGATPSVVSTQMEFLWFGIEHNSKEAQ